MTRPLPFACVIGDMDLIRPLGLEGIPCAVAGPKGAPGRWSRYARTRIDLPRSWDEPGLAIERLLAFAKSQDEPPVLLCGWDQALLAISRHRKVLEPWFRFILPEAELVEDVLDKQRFHYRATALGLRVPASQESIIGIDPVPTAAFTRFPAVVKPWVRSEIGAKWKPFAGLAKVVQVDTAEALTELWREPKLKGVPVLIQELVPGDETRVVSYHTFIDHDGTVVGDFTGRKIRTFPSSFGQSTAVEITDDPEVRAAGLGTLRALDFHGVAKLDYKIAPDGKLYLLEINARLSLWNHPGAVAGVNIPLAVYRRLIDGNVEPLPSARAGVTWCYTLRDVLAARAEGSSIRSWLRFASDSESRRVLNRDDPMAVVGVIQYGCRRFGRQALKKIRVRRGRVSENSVGNGRE